MTVAGEPVALLVIEMLPFTVPAVVGLNCTAKTTFWVGDNVTGALPPVIE